MRKLTNEIPMKPGYYWAKWRIAADGTHEGDELTPSNSWEIVQVNSNHIDWDDDPAEDEALSVAVPGVRETQWRDCFVWGNFVCGLQNDGVSEAGRRALQAEGGAE